MITSTPVPENVDAVKVAKLFKDYIYKNNGLRQKIISDRDRTFMSKFWKPYFAPWTQYRTFTSIRPLTDGQSEIANRKIEEMIRAVANFRKDNWDESISLILKARTIQQFRARPSIVHFT